MLQLLVRRQCEHGGRPRSQLHGIGPHVAAHSVHIDNEVVVQYWRHYVLHCAAAEAEVCLVSGIPDLSQY